MPEPKQGRLEQDARRERKLEALGALPGRAAVGHGARGLLRATATSGITSPTIRRAAGPTAGARTACSASPTAQGRLCFALALWNGRDPILKERLFGLTGPEGNHGEDVKEGTSTSTPPRPTPTCKALYKYPAGRVPLRAAGPGEPGARASPSPSSSWSIPASSTTAGTSTSSPSTPRPIADDILIRITVANRGPEAADAAPAADALVPQHLELGPGGRRLLAQADAPAGADRRSDRRRALGARALHARGRDGRTAARRELLFTENETNVARLFGAPNPQPYVKDAFHRAVSTATPRRSIPPARAPRPRVHYVLDVPAGGERVVRLRLRRATRRRPAVRAAFDARVRATGSPRPTSSTPSACRGRDRRRAAGRCGRDTPACSGASSSTTTSSSTGSRAIRPAAAARRARATGRNAEWPHVYSRDIISMPDKWEYPGSRPGTWPST